MASPFLRSAGSALRRSLPRFAATAEQRLAARRPSSSTQKARLFSSESAGNNDDDEHLRLLREIKYELRRANRKRVTFFELFILVCISSILHGSGSRKVA